MAMVGAAIAVFPERPAELGNRDDDGVAPGRADFLGKSR